MEKLLFSPMETDALGEMMNISLGSSATAVSNLLEHRRPISGTSSAPFPRLIFFMFMTIPFHCVNFYRSAGFATPRRRYPPAF